jgi:sphingomyelin phosphodiesterase acid-like 3
MPDTTRVINQLIIARVVSIAALLLCVRLASAAESASQFLWLSDLHFNPMADPQLVDALAAAGVEEWPRILGSSRSQKFPGFGEDTNWALLSSSFEAIRRTAPDVKFTVVTGDILAHRLREKFQATAAQHDDEAFRRFTLKTAQFVAAQLGTLAPGKPVLLTLGNNDNDCGDYALQPDGAFLKDGGAPMAKLLGPLADESSMKDWTALGSYSVPLPSLTHRRAIVVNSVYFSARYRNACSETGGDPAMEEMHWLEGKLAQAKEHKDKVWLIFHIAPGIDGFASSHQKDGGTGAVPMWKPVYTEAFEKLLARYHDTVSISLAGHEHVDDFRLIGGSLVQMTPGVSPVVGQNPGFRVVSFRANGALSDEATYYLSNLNRVLEGAGPEWKLEYSFAKTWGTRQVDFESFLKLSRDIEAKPEVRERWTVLYSVSGEKETAITKQAFPQLFCATGNNTEASFQACVKRIEDRR